MRNPKPQKNPRDPPRHTIPYASTPKVPVYPTRVFSGKFWQWLVRQAKLGISYRVRVPVG